LVYCVITGVQVIVKGSVPNEAIVSSLCKMFKRMIPKQCARTIEFSLEYRESWECNILGLELNANLPVHLESNDYALLELLSETAAGLTLTFKSNVKAIKTSLGSAIERLFQSKGGLELQRLDVVVKEWISKAKMFYAFSFGIQSDKDQRLKELQKAIEYQDTDMVVLKYWGAALKSLVMAKKITIR
jgi:folliculin